MKYEVFTPNPALQAFIKCFWTLESEASVETGRQRIVPDGCMEMIFHYGDRYRQYLEDGSHIIQPRSFIFGQITSYIEIEPTGSTGIIAARFMPDGLFAFLPMEARLLENKAIDIRHLFGRKGEELEERIISATQVTERLKILDTFLLSRLTDPKNVNAITKNCVDIILQSRGQMEVSKLAEKMRLNRRDMERKFTKTIGLSPKQLSKAVRLQATLKLLDQNNFESLTSLAYENGYYDQAHFIKDFKEFTGTSPKSFYSNNLRLAALFASGD